jgi:hypothetical protein
MESSRISSALTLEKRMMPPNFVRQLIRIIKCLQPLVIKQETRSHSVHFQTLEPQHEASILLL